jgi:fumarate reductase subunit D
MPPSSDLKRQLQRAVFRLVLLVVVVDALALGAYRSLDLAHATRDARFAFTVAWMVATLAVVLPTLWRVRVLRDQARKRR